MDSKSTKRCEHCHNKLEPAQPLKAPTSRLAKQLLEVCEWFYASPQRHRLSSNDSKIVSQKTSTEAERKSQLASHEAETVSPVEDFETTATSNAVETRKTAETSSIAAASKEAASSTGLKSSEDVARSKDAKDSDTVEAAGSEESSKSVEPPAEVFQAYCTASSRHTSRQTELEVSKFSDSGNERTSNKLGIRQRFSLPGRKFSLRRHKVSGERHSLKPESNITISNVTTISRNGQPLKRLPDKFLGNPRYFEGPVEMTPPWANVKAVSAWQRHSLGPRPPSSIYSQEDAADQNSLKSKRNDAGHERRSRPRALYLATSPDSPANKAVGPSTPQNTHRAIDASLESLESPQDSGYGGSEPSSSPKDRFQNGDSLKRLEGGVSGLGDEGRNWLSWTQSDAYRNDILEAEFHQQQRLEGGVSGLADEGRNWLSWTQSDAYRNDILEAEFHQQRDKIKQRLKNLLQDMRARSRASLEMFRRHEEVLGKCYNNTKVKVPSRSLRALQIATRNIIKVPDKYTANPPIVAIQTPLPVVPRLTINWPENSALLPVECMGESVEEERSRPWWEKQQKPCTGHVAYARKIIKKSKPGDGVPIFISDAYGDMVECNKSTDLRLRALSDETPPRLSVLPSLPSATSPRRKLTFEEPSKAAAAANSAPPRAFSDPIPPSPKSILAKKRSSERGNSSDQDPEFVHRVQSLQLQQLEELVKKKNNGNQPPTSEPAPALAPAQRRISIPPIRGMNVKHRDSLEPRALKPSPSEPRPLESRPSGTRMVQPEPSHPNLLRLASKANSCYRRDSTASRTDEMRKNNALRIMAVLRRSVAWEDAEGEDGEGLSWL